MRRPRVLHDSEPFPGGMLAPTAPLQLNLPSTVRRFILSYF